LSPAPGRARLDSVARQRTTPPARIPVPRCPLSANRLTGSRPITATVNHQLKPTCRTSTEAGHPRDGRFCENFLHSVKAPGWRRARNGPAGGALGAPLRPGRLSAGVAGSRRCLPIRQHGIELPTLATQHPRRRTDAVSDDAVPPSDAPTLSRPGPSGPSVLSVDVEHEGSRPADLANENLIRLSPEAPTGAPMRNRIRRRCLDRTLVRHRHMVPDPVRCCRTTPVGHTGDTVHSATGQTPMNQCEGSRDVCPAHGWSHCRIPTLRVRCSAV
jgi:hypothetical protein